jgi:uncharacterized phage infection (PIP) family protein YhgE
MATLAARITTLAQSIGADIKTLTANQGALTSLTTTVKTSLVAALNELKTEISALAAGDGGVAIDDSADGESTDTGVTWSAYNIRTQIDGAIDSLLGGASSAYDTLKELEELLTGQDTSLAQLLTAVNNRVRYDAAQTLTAAQKTQACANIGVGEPDTDFAASYTAAKA